MIPRLVNIAENIEPNKVLIIYGPRQVGKTTLVKEFLQTTTLSYQFYTGDDLEFRQQFGQATLQSAKQVVGSSQLLVIDEAQKIPNIGTALKLVVDNIPDIIVIVTGSSSFDLSNATSEPLTGRKNIITLYPIAIAELAKTHTDYQLKQDLSKHLIYGSYPNVITYDSLAKKQNRIMEIKDSYLIKDILEFNRIKSPDKIIKLLKMLAFQLGGEVSTTELAKKLGIDAKTVAYYLDLLEKSFVLYRLDGFSKNLRKEVTKMSKYFFYDLGIRNALINNFNAMESRNDHGQMWENYFIIERLKLNRYADSNTNHYFWRTYEQKEIDLIEQNGDALTAYECKWNINSKAKAPKDWTNNYPKSQFEVISPDNYLEFLELKDSV